MVEGQADRPPVLGGVEDQELVDKLLQLLRNLNESGLLDALIAFTDPEVVARLLGVMLTPGTMRLADNLDGLTNLAGDLVAALEKPVEPVSIFGFLRGLMDPEVARGLARMLEILRILGREKA